jgi:hypothetical protein
MATEVPQFEGPLRNPDLSEDDDRKLDTMMDGAGKTSGEAWRRIDVRMPGPTQAEASIADPHIQAASAAARRVVGATTIETHLQDVRQPAPPKRGETDQQIRDRHAEALRGRDESEPPGFDPEVAEQALERGRKGDFSTTSDGKQ